MIKKTHVDTLLEKQEKKDFMTGFLVKCVCKAQTGEKMQTISFLNISLFTVPSIN